MSNFLQPSSVMERPGLLFFCFLAYVLLSFNTYGQLSIPGKPYSYYERQNANSRLQNSSGKTVQLPLIDNEQEIKRANKLKESCKQCRKEYYGTGIDMILDIKQAGEKIDVGQGYVWIVKVKSASALGMQFYFSEYQLPAKSSLFIYNDGYQEVLGAFTHANNHIDRKFATEIIDGNEITLEYFESKDAEFAGDLKIYKVIHVFGDSQEFGSKGRDRNSAGKTWGDSKPCEIGINCPEGTPYVNEKKAVCRISFYESASNLNGFCSGFLINNNQSIREPYVLTADHCIDFCDPHAAEPCPSRWDLPDPASWPVTYGRQRFHEWVFEFNYEDGDCSPGGSPPPNTQSVSGASLVTWNRQADYALLDLSVNGIENLIDVNFLGWDKRDNMNFPSTVGIHHPAGDAKKISIDNNTTGTEHIVFSDDERDVQSYFGDGSLRTHWEINWDRGITEWGSSGSPLINAGSKLAIGFLSNGGSDCGSGGPDYYGRLAYAWDKYDPPFYYPLGHYLDPSGGTQIMASYIPNPISTEGPGPGGGGSGPGGLLGSSALYTGVQLTPTYMLGDFSDLDNAAELCAGTNAWTVVHGMPLVHPTYYVQLVSRYWGSSNRFASGIKRHFNFEQGKEYVLSLEIYNSDDNKPAADYLDIWATNNLPTGVCNEDVYTIGLPLQSQRIMKLDYAKYKDSYAQHKWWTYAIKFVAQSNFNTIYVKLVPKNTTQAPNTYYNYASVLIDRIGIHEKGQFNNPQIQDVKTIYNFLIEDNGYLDEYEPLHMANTQINVAAIVGDFMNIHVRSKTVVLKPGFKTLPGAIFRAEANDAIMISTNDNPVGPLDKNVISSLRSAEEYDTTSIMPPAEPPFVFDYSASENFHRIKEEQKAPGEGQRAVSIFPNPASSSVRIICESLGRNFRAALSDMKGKALLSSETENGVIILDVNEVPTGVYLVKCTNGKLTYNERIVVK